MAGAWALISAKQCVSVSDCVVFVREMVGAVGGAVIGCRLYFCGTVWIRWGCLIRLDYVVDGVGGWVVLRPFFISALFGWCVMMRGGGCVGAM